MLELRQQETLRNIQGLDLLDDCECAQYRAGVLGPVLLGLLLL